MIIFWVAWLLVLFAVILAYQLELIEDVVPFVAILSVSLFVLILATLEVIIYDPMGKPKIEYKQEPQIGSIRFYNEGYKRGQIDCQNDSLLWKKVMNNDGEIIFQKIK